MGRIVHVVERGAVELKLLACDSRHSLIVCDRVVRFVSENFDEEAWLAFSIEKGPGAEGIVYD